MLVLDYYVFSLYECVCVRVHSHLAFLLPTQCFLYLVVFQCYSVLVLSVAMSVFLLLAFVFFFSFLPFPSDSSVLLFSEMDCAWMPALGDNCQSSWHPQLTRSMLPMSEDLFIHRVGS